MEPIDIPGFTAEQNASLQAEIAAQLAASNKAIMDQMNVMMQVMIDNMAAMNTRFGLQPIQATHAIQQSTPPAPPAPQEAQKEVEQVKKKPLHQATVEDDTEDDNSMLANKSTLSSFSCLCTTRFSGDQAARLSNALHQHALILGLMLHLACQYTMFLAWQGFLLGYIECTEGMEASGEG